ncbi:hypothetical protein lbkm_3995 [Lachnospiraceae bacterium KM106-2]|nr:hypothetical protein lbkm_3995 [Lachnospiraceae bacterium KM106-2]
MGRAKVTNFLQKTKVVLLTVSMVATTVYTPWLDNYAKAEVNATVADGTQENDSTKVEKIDDGYRMTNQYFKVETGKYGQITSLQIVGDSYGTNYVMNAKNASQQDTSGHQWMGELMFQSKVGNAADWTESMTNASDSARKVELKDKKVIVTYENAEEKKGIKDFKLVETYSLVGAKLRWDIKVENTNDQALTIGDFGVPLAFNEYWSGGDEIYETRTVDHSFVGKDSSYVYVTRPSGLGPFLVMTPDTSTGAGFEYQDHWRTEERSADEAAWCQDQSGWANGLNVFYIHSDVIKSTNRGYLDHTSLKLQPGESKTYSFQFSKADSEKSMKKTLYEEGLIDAVAVPGMTFSKNMPAKMYLHTKVAKDDIDISIQCPHEAKTHEGHKKTTANYLECKKTDENTKATYVATKMIDDEQYHIYDLKFADLGQNNVIIKYNKNKQTVLQFYIMDSVSDALEKHSEFMVDKTQWNENGKLYDKVFDDWMMDTKSKRGSFDGYWGWGDDWGLTHGEYLAEKNVYQPVAKQIKAVDQYLDVAIWNGLMQEHQEDYKVHDFLMSEPNDTPTYRGYAYPHIYNTYFSMYKIASKYPDTISYKEKANTYLLRAYHILKALYSDGVSYNWETGLMGELTTPDIISALKKEGYYKEAKEVTDIMAKKYEKFKNTKYPYGSEYSYDNTGEEAVYTLAKVNQDSDSENAKQMMTKINAKTRACRGLQPIWYHYANPTTICGENWWNFQYSASLAGYCMDDYLRLEDNGMETRDLELAARTNYAAKLANLTCINSGQIDSDEANIGAVAWTYQSEMGNLGGQGTGGGNLHNGWRQMSGEADLGLFGALQILSSDVSNDPVFGLFGYGCNVKEENDQYVVTPLDGLYTRLNCIDEKIYMELERDQYTKAIVSKDGTSLQLEMKNLEQTKHTTNLDLTGLKEGSYEIKVDGQAEGSCKVEKNQTVTIPISLSEAKTAKVEIKQGGRTENQAPVVEAGEDKKISLSDTARVEGTVSDDGYPDGTLTYKWTVEKNSSDGKVTFSDAEQPISEVTFEKAGSYELKLTVSDGDKTASDTVTYEVSEDKELPKVVAKYDFNKENVADHTIKDIGGAGNDATYSYNPLPTFSEGKEGNGIEMKGGFSGYVKLPTALTKRVEQATISMDVKLSDAQENDTRLFEFGDMDDHYFYVSFCNGNELKVTATDLDTGKAQSVLSGVSLVPGYWKNIAVTLKENAIILAVDGIKKAELKESNFKLSGLGEVQRNYIGRSQNDKTAFLKGTVDNFEMRSYAMSADELKETYGTSEERKMVSSKTASCVTTVGTEPILPAQVEVLYSDGVYEKTDVEWEQVDKDSYSKAGVFHVKGKIAGGTITADAKVTVVAGSEKNLSSLATPTAIIDTPNDLGGVAGLNDGYDPSSSRDKEHGVWHNWQGDKTGPAWVQYTWEDKVVLTSMDAYYFTDGNFAPATVSVEYKDEEGNWISVSNPKGLGVALDQYNHTTFNPVETTAIRMIMTPAKEGIGVIEWKVFGYSDATILNKEPLKQMIKQASGIQEEFIMSGYDSLEAALKEAKELLDNKTLTQEQLDKETKKLADAIGDLVVIDNNIALTAAVSTSYVSSWETLGAVNDNLVSKNSLADGVKRYGTWGNESAYETVTYSWPVDMTIDSSDLYIWCDNGGILVPDSYTYQYLNEEGKWTEIKDAKGLETKLDQFNTTTFPTKIKTKELRIKLNKVAKDSNGVGLIEWKAIGKRYVEDKPTPSPEDSKEPEVTPTITPTVVPTVPAATQTPAPEQSKVPVVTPVPSKSPQESPTPTLPVKSNRSKLPKKGKVYKVQAYRYQITKSDSKKGTVTLLGTTNKKATIIKVADQVKIKGYRFKVTAISKNAFRKNHKIKSIIIGKNVTSIGAQAFYQCNRVSKITINTRVLRKVGSQAFDKIGKKAKIKVPKAKYNAYRKLLKKYLKKYQIKKMK